MSALLLVGLFVIAGVTPVVAVAADDAPQTHRGGAVEQWVTSTSSSSSSPAGRQTNRVRQMEARTVNKTDSPSLAPTLNRLVGASDRERYTERHGLTMRSGSVRVVIELTNTRSLPDGYQLVVETRQTDASQTLVQARVDVDELTALAADPAIQYIRPPRQGNALDGATTPSRPQSGGPNLLLSLGGGALMLLAVLVAVLYTLQS